MSRSHEEARPIFVLGTGRCGSSLVQEVIARHPDVGFVSNVEDRWPRVRLGAASGRLYRALPPTLSVKGRMRFAPSEGYRALDVRVSTALSRPVRDLTAADATPWLTERLRRYFDSFASACGRPVLVHKFTGWPRAGLLQTVWPDAKFVHIVRDGRAVASSWLQMPWWRGWDGPAGWSFGPLPDRYQDQWLAAGQSFVALAGLQWLMLLDAFDAARGLVPADSWLELRYEDVVADPRAAFATMLDFCGLPWTPTFQRGFDRYTFSSVRTLSFSRDLSRAQVALLEELLGDRLSRYGYQPLPLPAPEPAPQTT